jgi:hypothetical protein
LRRYTLVLAEKDLSPAEYNEWAKAHHTASTALTGREEKLAEAGGSLITSTKPTLNLLLLLVAGGYGEQALDQHESLPPPPRVVYMYEHSP